VEHTLLTSSFQEEGSFWPYQSREMSGHLFLNWEFWLASFYDSSLVAWRFSYRVIFWSLEIFLPCHILELRDFPTVSYFISLFYRSNMHFIISVFYYKVHSFINGVVIYSICKTGHKFPRQSIACSFLCDNTVQLSKTEPPCDKCPIYTGFINRDFLRWYFT
jgi:hypothetical protein